MERNCLQQNLELQPLLLLLRGPRKGFDLSNAFGLASKVLTSDVAALGVLLATAVSLLASASGFGDEILKNTVEELVF